MNDRHLVRMCASVTDVKWVQSGTFVAWFQPGIALHCLVTSPQIYLNITPMELKEVMRKKFHCWMQEQMKLQQLAAEQQELTFRPHTNRTGTARINLRNPETYQQTLKARDQARAQRAKDEVQRRLVGTFSQFHRQPSELHDRRHELRGEQKSKHSQHPLVGQGCDSGRHVLMLDHGSARLASRPGCLYRGW